MNILITVVACAILATAIVLFFNLKKEKKIKTEMEQKHSHLSKNLNSNILYAQAIASGNYDMENNASVDDELGLALMEMSKNLKIATEEEKNRSWSMTGLGKITEIIRVSNHDMETLSNNLISFLVKYMNANQGGIFVLDDTDKANQFLEMKGCFAYERKKYVDRKISLDEGLLGQAVKENDTIYLTDLPLDYVHITSGLGQANPNALIIVPLKTEEMVTGVLEIASFFKFRPHEIAFLQKASENIASSIIISKKNNYTLQLLNESQELAGYKAQQEEEMRQNMEELQSIQENLVRKQNEMEHIQNELKISKEHLATLVDSIPVPVNVKDRQHRLVLVNAAFCNIMKKDKNFLLGKTVHDRFEKVQADTFWQGDEKIFNSNEIQVNEEIVKYTGDETKTVITYKYPFKSPDGNTYIVTTIVDVFQRKG